MSSVTESDADACGLADLRAEFPRFRIWQETVGDRVRYVACRLNPGAGPHTIVTADPGEIRAVLNQARADPQATQAQALDTSAPNIARVYAHWLGGKDSFAADRRAADAVASEFPEIALVAKANRAFVIRTVAYTAALGIKQFIDIGTGLPTSPSVHDTAARADPAARVIYVDHDPVVLAHARALLATRPGVTILAGDLRQPDAILAAPQLRRAIDLAQPTCIILAAVLHFLPASEADAIVAAVRRAIAPGSYLVISSGTSSGTSPALIAHLAAAYQGTTVVSSRTAEEIAAYFTGLHLVPPGLTDVWAWRPDNDHYWPPPPTARILGAVARKPASPGHDD